MRNRWKLTHRGGSTIKAQIHRAFTMVELLVVIAIVALLSAVLLSAFNGARERSRRTTCASNLKQIGVALELYAQDNRGFYPIPITYPAADDGECFWGDRIFSYVRSTKVFECPSHPYGEYRTGCPAKEEISGHNYAYHGSYAINVMGNTSIGNSYPPLNQVQIRNPSGSILATGNFEEGSATYVDPARYPINAVNDLEVRGIYRRHGAGDNLLFADGHVKWMSLESMVQKGRDLWLTTGAP